MYKRGKTVPEITNAFPRKISKTTVWKHVHNCGIQTYNRKCDKLDKLKSIDPTGKTYREIGREAGCSHVYAYNYFKDKK